MRGELLFLPLLRPEAGPVSGVDWLDSGCFSSLCLVSRCLARDLSSIIFPHSSQAAFLMPGVGEGGAVSEGVGRQDGGDGELATLSVRQLRVLLTGSVLTALTTRRVRGMAGVNISLLDCCFSVDFRATPVLLLLALTGVIMLGVSLK